MNTPKKIVVTLDVTSDAEARELQGAWQEIVMGRKPPEARARRGARAPSRGDDGARAPARVDYMLMTPSFTRTLRFKVRPESYGWLCVAAAEVNAVFP